uniref:TonB-dependent receptor plug domain-containing protein n=1 Tax=Ferruginibacter sp. TaxID=1940288 RepID=UPI00265A78BA
MKLKLRLLCVGIFLGSFLQQTIAQNITVAGKVKSKTTSEALMRATVSIKGTSTSTSTDESGNFQISIPKGGSLVVTSIGFLSSTYVVKKQGDVLILMEDGNKQMEEVIVIGYGTQKVTKVSGAISTIKTDAIEKASPVRVEDAIQGRASGVTIVQSGSPGVKPTLFVRGIPSYNGSDPLVVVDGSIQTLDDLNAINPSDVESINILKDAAATAIYGVSGGNGVIVLTTKSGKKNQKTQFSISSSAGLQKVANNIPVLNATEYAAMLNEGSTTSGDGIIFPDISKLGVGTNWQDQIFKSAPIQSHSISASGGSDKMTYFLSGGYNDQAGILGGIDKSNFGRTNFTANLNFQLTPKLKFVVNATEVLLSSKGVKEGTWNG